MAEHEGVRQHKDESGVHRRRGPEEPTRDKRGERDQRPEAKDTDAASLESHADLLSDARFSQAANAGQRASIIGDLQKSYGNA